MQAIVQTIVEFHPIVTATAVAGRAAECAAALIPAS
jgi:hypothetical protein